MLRGLSLINHINNKLVRIKHQLKKKTKLMTNNNKLQCMTNYNIRDIYIYTHPTIDCL